MANDNENVYKFKEDSYWNRQNDNFKIIDDYNLKEKLSEYFDKYIIKNGSGRFTGLSWRELVFNKKYAEKFKPYTGVQIYLYSINKEEIGDISNRAFKSNITNQGKKEFPYDQTNKYYLIHDNTLIDCITGNLIKKDDSLQKAQIWFCQKEEGGNHPAILEKGHHNNNICDFKEILKNVEINNNLECRKAITKYYIGKYFKELQNQKLVSSEINCQYDWKTKGENNCVKIVRVIEKLIKAREKYLNEAK